MRCGPNPPDSPAPARLNRSRCAATLAADATTLIFIVYFVIFAVSGRALAADSREFTVRGTITSRMNFYDAAGNSTQPPKEFLARGLRTAHECDFAFYRKNAKWRLDIEHPDPNFDEGTVWRTLLPSDGGGFLSIISYPPRPGVPENKGNAHVTVLTNQYLPREDRYGAHAAWLIFNLNEIVAIESPNACPPIWSFNPREHDMRVNSHMIIRTNEATIFWNTGRFAARDEHGNVILENGQPSVKSHPPPYNQGWVEAEYRPTPDFLSVQLRIPKGGVFTTWAPTRDEKEPRGMRMHMLTEERIENKEVSSRSLSESLFEPTWTNKFAVVADFRREGTVSNQPLVYITKSNSFDASERELNRRKR
jgi:hypothetical protein